MTTPTNITDNANSPAMYMWEWLDTRLSEKEETPDPIGQRGQPKAPQKYPQSSIRGLGKTGRGTVGTYSAPKEPLEKTGKAPSPHGDKDIAKHMDNEGYDQSHPDFHGHLKTLSGGKRDSRDYHVARHVVMNHPNTKSAWKSAKDPLPGLHKGEKKRLTGFAGAAAAVRKGSAALVSKKRGRPDEPHIDTLARNFLDKHKVHKDGEGPKPNWRAHVQKHISSREADVRAGERAERAAGRTAKQMPEKKDGEGEAADVKMTAAVKAAPPEAGQHTKTFKTKGDPFLSEHPYIKKHRQKKAKHHMGRSAHDLVNNIYKSHRNAGKSHDDAVDHIHKGLHVDADDKKTQTVSKSQIGNYVSGQKDIRMSSAAGTGRRGGGPGTGEGMVRGAPMKRLERGETKSQERIQRKRIGRAIKSTAGRELPADVDEGHKKSLTALQKKLKREQRLAKKKGHQPTSPDEMAKDIANHPDHAHLGSSPANRRTKIKKLALQHLGIDLGKRSAAVKAGTRPFTPKGLERGAGKIAASAGKKLVALRGGRVKDQEAEAPEDTAEREAKIKSKRRRADVEAKVAGRQKTRTMAAVEKKLEVKAKIKAGAEKSKAEREAKRPAVERKIMVKRAKVGEIRRQAGLGPKHREAPKPEAPAGFGKKGKPIHTLKGKMQRGKAEKEGTPIAEPIEYLSKGRQKKIKKHSEKEAGIAKLAPAERHVARAKERAKERKKEERKTARTAAQEREKTSQMKARFQARLEKAGVKLKPKKRETPEEREQSMSGAKAAKLARVREKGRVGAKFGQPFEKTPKEAALLKQARVERAKRRSDQRDKRVSEAVWRILGGVTLFERVSGRYTFLDRIRNAA